MPETIQDSLGTRERATQRRRSRTYGSPGVGTVDGPDKSGADPAPAAGDSPQGDFMRIESFAAGDDGSGARRGPPGEGAGTTGNSVRGALSGGLSGATTTRGGEQGGIGASADDSSPAAADLPADDSATSERDLTLGEAYGGVMEQPERDE